MEINLDAGTIISTLLLFIVTYGISGTFSRINKIRDHQAKLFNLTGQLTTWTKSHEKIDDERHEEAAQKFKDNSDEHREIMSKIDSMRS